MRFTLICLVFLLFWTIPTQAQQIVINELYNSSSTDEWIELLVLQDSLDLRGWDIRDFSSGGAAQQPLVFSSNALWSAVPKGTMIVIGGSTVTFAEDMEVSDRLLVVKATNTLYFSGTTFSFAGASEAVQIRNTGDVHVFGVSWGSANTASIPDPKVHSTNSVASATSVAFLQDSAPELTAIGNWTYGSAVITRGAGNTPANIGWLNALRLTSDGSGTAGVTPDTLFHGQTNSLAITYARDTMFAVTDLRVIIPQVFSWSGLAGDVQIAGVTATLGVAGDSISLSGISWVSNTAEITIASVGAPDSTAFYPIPVQSRSETALRTIAASPVVTAFGIPSTIAQVKGNTADGIVLRSGQLVTVRGIVTVANQIGGPSYMQDLTGGIALYDLSFAAAVQTGDEVVVSGRVDPFNGLTELAVPYLHAIVSSGNEVTPIPVTCAAASNDGAGGIEQYEALLIRLNGVVVRDAAGSAIPAWTVASSGSNYKLLDGTDTLEVRVDNDVNFANTPAPQGTFDIIGVLGQFKSALPFIGGYQLIPRSSADILASGPGIATVPVEKQMTPSGLHLTWTTMRPGTSRVRYGKTAAFELGIAEPDTLLKQAHDVPIGGLQPATMYHVQAFSVSGLDTSRAGTMIVSTASPASATGAINVYFNKNVYAGFPSFVPLASGNQNLVARLLTRINAAQHSIDVALYSLSGTSGMDLAQALIAARSRGVSVRVTCEQDNRDRAPLNSLASAGVPLITDSYDAVNAGAGLMHNKFVVIDGRGGTPDSVWVWTGSWNPTDPGTNDDYQNAIEIQDLALGGAYTAEFNEMWGGTTDAPNASLSRFGARKTDNTPHRFIIGGRPVSCYFSPSDRTTSHIIEVLNTAHSSIHFSLLTLTRSDIANTLLARRAVGATVLGAMDGRDDLGSQYDYLTGQGVDIRLKSGPGLLHHKYAIIDGNWGPNWQMGNHPTVITGSHNWSNSAENTNNENTLIIEDDTVSLVYLQEFAARYYQFGGTDTITVAVREDGSGLPQSMALLQNYPNPFNGMTEIGIAVQGAAASTQHVTVKIYDILGREVSTLLDGPMAPGVYRLRFDAPSLASGVYLYTMRSGGFTDTKKMILVR